MSSDRENIDFKKIRVTLEKIIDKTISLELRWKEINPTTFVTTKSNDNKNIYDEIILQQINYDNYNNEVAYILQLAKVSQDTKRILLKINTEKYFELWDILHALYNKIQQSILDIGSMKLDDFLN